MVFLSPVFTDSIPVAFGEERLQRYDWKTEPSFGKLHFRLFSNDCS
jgi:hypothetical protein